MKTKKTSIGISEGEERLPILKTSTKQIPVYGSPVIRRQLEIALTIVCDFAKIPPPTETIKVKYSDIKFRDDLYPRIKDSKRVRLEIYSARQKNIKTDGKHFEGLDSITINQHKELIDGYIRLKAYRLEANSEDFEVWAHVIPTQDDTELLQRMIEHNNQHGLPYTPRERRKAANMLSDKGVEVDEIAKKLSVKKSTVYKYLDSKKKRANKKRNKEIIKQVETNNTRTLEEIGDEYGLDKSQVSRIVNEHYKKIIKNRLLDGKPLEDARKEINIPRDKFDKLAKEVGKIEKIILPNWPKDKDTGQKIPFPTNYWHHTGDKRSEDDEDFPGKTPICYLENLLYYHTKPNNVVVDVFAGSGTMLDAAKNMQRGCYATDLFPQRDEIDEWDIVNGLPPKLETYDKIKLIFLDPPYWERVKYSDKKTDLSCLTLPEFNEAMNNLLVEIGKLETIEQVAILIEPTVYIKSKVTYIDHTLFLYNNMPKDFEVIARYGTMHGTKHVQTYDALKDARRCAILLRDLWVYSRRHVA